MKYLIRIDVEFRGDDIYLIGPFYSMIEAKRYLDLNHGRLDGADIFEVEA